MDEVSIRCGKGNCEHYDCYNKISGCKIYSDRRKCNISMEQLKKVKAKSRKQKQNWW